MSNRNNDVARFGDWVGWLTASERSHLLQMAEQEPQERWVEHYRKIALDRARILRAGFRSLFSGVRGAVSRLARVRVAPRVEPVEIDPMTGRPYGEILWEPVRPAPGFETPRMIWLPRKPRPPYPGYPIGQPSLRVAPVAPAVGEVVKVSGTEFGIRKPGYAGRPIRE